MSIQMSEVDEYLLKLHPKRDPVLTEMEWLAKKNDFPIVGPVVGNLLALLVQLNGVRRVFEMGSGFGYSAYWFARVLPDEGKVICTDTSEENAVQGMEFLKRGGLDHKVEYRIGDALELARSAEGPFEFVFNDVDKELYPDVFRIVVPKLRPGALFVTDNLLWHGKVLGKESDRTTEAVRNFTRLMFGDPGLSSSIIPIRDGVGICLKL